MEYTFLPPPHDLKSYISHFWVGKWNVNAAQANTKHIIIANSLLEITFAFKDSKRHAELLFTTVQGQTDRPLQHTVPGFYHLFGVSIYAHAVSSVFGLPPAEVSNAHLSLDTFLSSKPRLSEKIALADSNEARMGILSDFFRQQLRNRPFRDTLMLDALDTMQSRYNEVPITELAKQSHLSQKQFNRRFKDFTGFNPKIFARITRLEAALKNYVPGRSFTDLALASGYYDQAHFIHEFKTLTGFRPGEFWKLSEADRG